MAGSNKIDQLNTFCLDGRLESFKLAKWPQFKPTAIKGYKISPDSMANAGFQARPIEGSPDNAACPYCMKNLDGWGQEDVAWDEHVSHSASCPLVGLGEQVNRELTFTMANWPHSGSIAANKMAKAGFFYWPRHESEDDTAICVQCGLALDGWEANDDPRHEHARRRPKCPFLVTGKTHAPTHFELLFASKNTESALREPKVIIEPVTKKRRSSTMDPKPAPKFKIPAVVKQDLAIPVVSKKVASTPLKQSIVAAQEELKAEPPSTVRRASARRNSIRNAAPIVNAPMQVEMPAPVTDEPPKEVVVAPPTSRRRTRQSVAMPVPQFKLPEVPCRMSSMMVAPSIPSTPLTRKTVKTANVKGVLAELTAAGLSFTQADLKRPLTEVLQDLVERRMLSFDQAAEQRFAAFELAASLK